MINIYIDLETSIGAWIRNARRDGVILTKDQARRLICEDLEAHGVFDLMTVQM